VLVLGQARKVLRWLWRFNKGSSRLSAGVVDIRAVERLYVQGSLFGVEVGLVNLDTLQILVLIIVVKEVLRHYRVSIDLVLPDLLPLLYVLCLVLEQLAGEDGLSHYRLLLNWALGLSLEVDFSIVGGGCDDRGTENLLELWVVIATLRVNVVCLHVLPVDSATSSRIGIPVAVGVKGRFAKVRGDGRVREPSAHMFHLMDLVLDILELLGSLSSLLLNGLLSLLLLHFLARLFLLLALLNFQPGTVLRAVGHGAVGEHLIAKGLKVLLLLVLGIEELTSEFTVLFDKLLNLIFNPLLYILGWCH
jgi:hypothetical protein